MIFNLQIIRHGKTEAVPKSIYCGYSDLPLSKEGIDEIKEFIALNMYRPACCYYSSGLKRAVETLNLIANNPEWEEIRELRECNFGDFELHTHAELLSLTSYNEWINDKTGKYLIPNGESVEIFNKRVEKGFECLFKEITEKHCASAMLTTHGGVIAHFIRVYYDPDMNMYEAMPSHGRGYDLDIDFNGSKIEIISINKI